jgi:hypothetical protein
VTQNFDRLLHRLADSGLDFVIIGGFAAVTHGSALMTRDLDICVLLTNETVEKLRTILADWHPRHRMTPQKLSFLEFPKTGTVQNLYLETDFGVVDILVCAWGRRLSPVEEMGGSFRNRWTDVSGHFTRGSDRGERSDWPGKGFAGCEGAARDRGKTTAVISPAQTR